MSAAEFFIFLVTATTQLSLTQLGNPHYPIRENASRILMEYRLAVLPQVERLAQQSKDLETRKRAERIYDRCVYFELTYEVGQGYASNMNFDTLREANSFAQQLKEYNNQFSYVYYHDIKITRKLR